MRNILVAMDFEAQAQQLLNQTQQLAKAFSAKVWLIHVAAPNPDFVGYEAGPQVVRDQRAQELRAEHKLLDQWASALETEGIDTVPLLIQGPTTETLLSEAQRLQADLMVIGAHQHGWMYQAFFGSITDAVIHQTKIPVLVVPI